MDSRHLVSVVDDDESVRESLLGLLHEYGFEVEVFASADEFLASAFVDQTRCLLLDITMPGMSGPELQRELSRQRRTVPVVFITANADDTIRPLLKETGTVACLFKPFSEPELLEAISVALNTT